MDIANTLIGIALLLIIAIPVFIINYASKKKRSAIVNQAIQLFSNKPSKLSEYDVFCGDSIIALHENEVCVYSERQNINSKTIALQQVLKVSLYVEYSKISNQNNKTISKVALLFEMKSSKAMETILLFQMDDTNFMISDELRIAKHWEEKLNAKL